jgi:hypothetical protein
MDPKELRGLMEAYSEVYAPQEVDEEMKPLPKEKMERQAMKAYKKERSAIDRRDDPEANRQMQRRIAMQSPASRRNVLQNKKMGEEVQQIDVDEAVKGASRHDTEMRKASAAERKSGIKNRLSPAAGKDNANKMQRDINYFDKLTKKNNNEEVEIFDTVLEFLQAEGYAETLEEAEWLMANVIDEEAIDIILGEEQLDEISNELVGRAVNKRIAQLGAASDREMRDRTPENVQSTVKASEKHASMKIAAARRRERMNTEEYMDEAQEARNNPEKYEREQSKKYAPVRGEKTPMPPRGDKRREDFEKWYAANGPK